MVLESKFDIGQQITVIAVKMCGCVDSILWDSAGTQYRVVYWNDGKREAVWMYEWEIA
jgi:hypothetical protein